VSILKGDNVAFPAPWGGRAESDDAEFG